MAEEEKRVLKKKIITFAAALMCLLMLCACGTDIAKEAAEKGRAYFDSGDYETAAKAFSVAVEHGNTDDEVNRLYDITLKFYQAGKAYEEKDFAEAQKILSKMDESYVNYGIAEKITTLKSDVEKSVQAQTLLAEVSDKLSAGDLASAVAAAEKIDTNLLSPEQTDKLNEYKTSIASLQAAQAEKQEQEKKAAEDAKKLEAQKQTAAKQAAKTSKKNTAKKTAASPKKIAAAINVNVSADAYIYPSDTTLLTAEQLKTMSRADLALLRNEIYARKGHIFTTNKYISYFSAKTWYKPVAAVLWKDLNNVEKANIKLIKEYESKL